MKPVVDHQSRLRGIKPKIQLADPSLAKEICIHRKVAFSDPLYRMKELSGVLTYFSIGPIWKIQSKASIRRKVVIFLEPPIRKKQAQK